MEAENNNCTNYGSLKFFFQIICAERIAALSLMFTDSGSTTTISNRTRVSTERLSMQPLEIRLLEEWSDPSNLCESKQKFPLCCIAHLVLIFVLSISGVSVICERKRETEKRFLFSIYRRKHTEKHRNTRIVN